jgi:glycosyltransferase involved in cell wall biosynthesis
MNQGGAETLLMNLYRNVDRTKVQFDFLTCKEGVFDNEICNFGGKIHRIPYITDVGHLKYVKELNLFFVNNTHYKIIHCHMDKMSGLVLRSARKAGIPIRISHSHNTRSEGNAAAKLYKWYVGNFIIKYSTHLLACSTEAAIWLFKKRSSLAEILRNGIEYHKFAYSPAIRKEKRDELKINGKLVIGHVGRFNQQKNHSFLIEIFKKINELYEDSILVLVGDGPLKSEIVKKIIKLDLDGKVLFLGVRNDINHLLQAFDVFVFPSKHEGLPVSLIEAQGAGLPCIISDVISEEVDLGNQLIVMEDLKNSPENWAKKVLKQNNKRVVDSTEAFKINGYDINKTATWLQNYYLKLINSIGTE